MFLFASQLRDAYLTLDWKEWIMFLPCVAPFFSSVPTIATGDFLKTMDYLCDDENMHLRLYPQTATNCY